MSEYTLFSNMLMLFVIGIVLETAVSAMFSITAVKVANNNMAVKTTREAITYIAGFLSLFFIKELRLFANTGLNLPALADYIVSSLVTVRFSLFIRDLFNKIA